MHSRAETPRELTDAIVRQLPIMAMLCDKSGRMLSVTDEMWRAFAPGRVREPGLPWTELLPYPLSEAAGLAERLSRATGAEQASTVGRVDVRLSGEDRAFRVTVAPAPQPHGAAIVYVEEQTGILALEAQFQASDNTTRLGALAGTIAHEIRNPLAGISATVQLVLATMAPEDRRRTFLSRVLVEVERLDDLVEDLMVFARPIVAQRTPTDLAQVARSVVDGFGPRERGGTVVVGAGAADADAGLLALSLASVLQNAWQAGANRVEVRVAGPEIAVYDDGPGIPAALAKDVFKPFVTTKTRGTGLGLPNAARAVEAMGGAVALTPSPLGGAGFVFRLRAVADPG